MRSTRLSLALFSVLLVSSVARPAVAAHGPIQTLDAATQGATEVHLGIDDQGTATAAWSEGGQIFVATRPLDGRFGSPQRIVSAYASEFELDVAPNGNAVIVAAGAFNEGEVVAAVRIGRTNAFGALQVLSPPADAAGAEVSAAMTSAGRAAAAWSRNGATGRDVVAALSNASGTFGDGTVVDSGGDLRSPEVDGDQSGNIILAYYWQVTGTGDEIRIATAPSAGAFTAPKAIETLSQGPTEVDVAVNATGVAAVAWADFTGESNSCGANCLSRDVQEAAVGNVNGTFGAVQELTDPNNPHAAGDTQVAVDDSGRVGVLFNAVFGTDYGMFASVSDATGVFPQRQHQTLSLHGAANGPGVDKRAFEISAGGGEFTAVWTNDHDEDGVDESWESTSSGGTFGTVHQLSPAALTESTDRTDGARNATGATIAGWTTFTNNYTVQVTPVSDTAGETGTDGDDDLDGSSGDDTIYLAAGNDTYNASGGNDSVYGEAGNDKLAGGTGTDLLDGGANSDALTGGDGGDTLKGGGGNDVLTGDGANTIARADGTEGRYFAAAGGVDILLGGGGRDRLIGGAGLDRLNGGPGADVCIVDSRKEKRRAQSCETIRLRRGHL